jgi:hypothetical protein
MQLFSTWAGSIFVYEYQARVEVTHGEKRSSLLRPFKVLWSYSTRVGSSFAHKYWTWVKVSDSEKRSNS